MSSGGCQRARDSFSLSDLQLYAWTLAGTRDYAVLSQNSASAAGIYLNSPVYVAGDGCDLPSVWFRAASTVSRLGSRLVIEFGLGTYIVYIAQDQLDPGT